MLGKEKRELKITARTREEKERSWWIERERRERGGRIRYIGMHEDTTMSIGKKNLKLLVEKD